MAKEKMGSIYSQVVCITHVYLGPAADRFIKRQVENHLHKPAEDLTKADLLSLIDWIRVVVGLITDNGEIIEEYMTELQKLTDNNQLGNDK